MLMLIERYFRLSISTFESKKLGAVASYNSKSLLTKTTKRKLSRLHEEWNFAYVFQAPNALQMSP